MIRSRTQTALVTLLIAIGIVQSGTAQSDGNIVERFAPDDCTAFFGWCGELKVDPNGTATERWLAQTEIQVAVAQLHDAIEGYLRVNPMNDRNSEELVRELPWLLLKNPFAVYFRDFDPSTNPPEFTMGAIAKLGEQEAWAKKILAEAVESINEDEPAATRFREEEIGGHRLFVTRKDGNEFACGVMNGMFVAAFGAGEMNRLLDNMKSPEPDWVRQVQQEVPAKRRVGLFRLNTEEIWKLAEQQEAPLPKDLHLHEIQEVIGAMDLHQEEMVTTTLIRCPSKTNGVLSMLDVAPMTMDHMSEIPSGISSAYAFRMSLENTWKMTQIIARELQIDDLDEFVSNIEEDTGLDFEEEILGSLDGTFTAAAKLDLINPLAGNLLSIRIKNPAEFKDHFRAINEAIQDEVEFYGEMSYSQKESGGVTIHSVEGSMANFFWCLVDNQILLGFDRSAVRSQLRKRKRSDGKLTEDERVARLFSNKTNGNPLAVSYTNIGDSLKAVLPMFGALFGDQTPHPDFAFSMRDLPSAEVLANGLSPNISAFYRTESGFKMVEHHVLPGNSSIALTGVAIGMLLPAVQAVRHASRRTVSMNNMRQLVLSNLNYESAYQSYPAAYTKDKNGKPLLSWRVHILPYLDELELYEKFRLDEPWDSPHNRKLIAQMPDVYSNPAAALEPGMTTYLGVTGKNAVLAAPQESSEKGEMKKGTTLGQIPDGTSNTLLVVDVNQDHAVTWTKPEDFDPDAHDNIRQALAGTWTGDVIMVARCDGSVTIMASDVSDEQLRQMMKRNDGKTGKDD